MSPMRMIETHHLFPVVCLCAKRSLVGVVVEDIKTLAASLSYVKFQHVCRTCNSSAHTLARRAVLSGSCLFRVIVPECIRDKLCIDYI
jgi:hypothetical protein